MLDAGVHVIDKAYLRVYGPLWCYIANADNEETFSEKGVIGPFVDRIGRKGDGDLRSDILWACASVPDDRPYPACDKVVFLTQAHCDKLYHVMAEVWRRPGQDPVGGGGRFGRQKYLPRAAPERPRGRMRPRRLEVQ